MHILSAHHGVAPVSTCPVGSWDAAVAFIEVSQARPENNSVEKLISNWNWVFSSICFPLQSSLLLSLSLSLSISDFIVRSSHLLRRRNRNQNHKKTHLEHCQRTVLIGLPVRDREREREMGEMEMEKPDDSNYQLCFVSCHNKFLHIIDGALYIR